MAEIRHVLSIAAPAAAVYTALTEHEPLASWWMPEVRAEPREGSIAEFRHPPYPYHHRMRIKRLEPGRCVEWECLQADPEPEWNGTKLSFELEEEKGQTRVRFRHAGWRALTDHVGECTHHWGRVLNRMKRLCESGAFAPEAEATASDAV